MYNSIYLSNITEGSNTLPSILKINKGTYKDNNTTVIGGYHYDSDSGQIIFPDKMTGVLPNDANAFTIEFYSNLSNDMGYNIKNLYNQVTEDAYISISKKYLETNFYIYEIEDYSAQAMTIGHYDFIAKIFVNNKIISKDCIAVIKYYTAKKAYILVDKMISINDNNDNVEIYIDFSYNFTKIEDTLDVLKYFDNYTGVTNLQGLLNDPTKASPYLDKYFINNTDNNTNNKITHNVLNKQNQYFSYSNSNNFINESNNKINTELNINKILAREDNNTLTDEEYKVENIKNYHIIETVNKNAINNYTKRLCYEVYGFTNNSKFGTRVFNTDNINDYSTYDVYTIPTEMIHYIFEYLGNDIPLITDLKKYVKSFMKNNSIYLYNYYAVGDYDVRLFEEDSKKYVDVYIPFPNDRDYSGEGYNNDENNLSSNISVYVKATITDAFDPNETYYEYIDNEYSETEDSTYDSEKTYYVISSQPISFLNITTLDSRSYYDPTRLYQNTSDNNSPFIPYFLHDDYIESIKSDGVPFIVTNESDVDVLDIQLGNIYNKKFDILAKTFSNADIITHLNNNVIKSYTKNDFPGYKNYEYIETQDSSFNSNKTYYEYIDNEYTITEDTVYNSNKIYYEYIETIETTQENIFKTIKNKDQILQKNLSLLLPENISNSIENIGKDITVTGALFLYVESTGNKLEVTMKTDDKIIIKDYVYAYETNKFIIPVEDGIDEISFENNVKYYVYR